MSESSSTFPAPRIEDVPKGWTAATVDDAWRWTLTSEHIDELVVASGNIDPGDDDCVARLHLEPFTLSSLEERIDDCLLYTSPSPRDA